MSAVNIADGTVQAINPDYFTGRTRLRELSSGLNTAESKIYNVDFFGGARTKIHKHTGAQILITTRGAGTLTLYKKIGRGRSRFRITEEKAIPLQKGGMAYIPPNVLHAHGAAAEGIFSHIAINLFPSEDLEPETAWYESNFKDIVTARLK